MNRLFRPLLGLILFLWVAAFPVWGQENSISGVVLDEKGEPLIGVGVRIAQTQTGAATDVNGRFALKHSGSFPVTLVVQYIGYQTKNVDVKKPVVGLSIRLQPDATALKEISVVERRLSEKQKESALTVEAMDALAIKETPAVNFYEGLASLKGVDLTSASIGFKVINTRGFNSTSPVRSLQLIDGVDNQAPGLNFSLGNFLGASDLDVQQVDLIAGASSAYYGPNAFNGVIAMTTKNPFDFPGLSASVKVGERNLAEFGLRWAQVFKDGDGVERFAYKFNLFYLRADDWEASNLDPTAQSEEGIDNPGRYDAVNRYGDEVLFDDGGDVKTYPGLGNYYRNGLMERDLVDYDTRNLKLGTSLHYRFQPDLELTYAFNFGNGTTVYQGDNRYSLKDILFFQNRIELARKQKWFVRAYATNEDAGNSYDAYFTALRMQEAYLGEQSWGNFYRNFFSAFAVPSIKQLEGYPDPSLPADEFSAQMDALIAANPEFFAGWHDSINRLVATAYEGPGLVPGTASFDSLFQYVVSRDFNEGGTRLVDRSALYHLQGEYLFDSTRLGHFRLGGNYRLYRPLSEGTIFRDSAGLRISNREFGIYGGWEQKFARNKLKLGASLRMDKNENFDYLFSPAVSAVYQVDAINTLRLSFSSAIRNPTLQDQYLYYNVGRAILLGNLEGYDSLVTTDEVVDFLGAGVQERANWEFDYYAIDPVRPERVQTVEMGYRTTLWNRLYLDLNYYFSWYTDFIGYNIGLDIEDDPSAGPIQRLTGVQAYRIATNAQDQVTTQGFSIGGNYYFGEYYSLNGNYSWNVLNTATDDPIIPAFNTPEHKYNIGISARDWQWRKIKNVGFSANYKWIQGFLFEGSPQFTGSIEDYSMLDAQVSWKYPAWKTTFKLGASNVLNQRAYQVYGGPEIGRLAYFNVLFEL